MKLRNGELKELINEKPVTGQFLFKSVCFLSKKVIIYYEKYKL